VIIDIYAHHISERVGKFISRGKYYGPGRSFRSRRRTPTWSSGWV